METPSSQAVEPAPHTHAVPEQSLASDVQFLRLALLVLGAGVVLLSICLGLFLYKQNNLLIAQIDSQTRLLNQNEPVYENTKQRLGMLLQDLQAYAQTHNDVVPILIKYNLGAVRPQSSSLGPIAIPAQPPPAR